MNEKETIMRKKLRNFRRMEKETTIDIENIRQEIYNIQGFLMPKMAVADSAPLSNIDDQAYTIEKNININLGGDIQWIKKLI